jgi:predicted amidophosphoribosyltransferase
MISALKTLLPACGNCENPSWDLFCEGCFEKLQFRRACSRCGRAPLTEHLSECIPCSELSKDWEETWISFFYEGGVRNWILEWKDFQRPERIRELKIEHLPCLDTRSYEVLVPVSSDPHRTRKRFYDPTLLLAKRLSHLWKIPVFEGAFRRQEFLQPQKELSAEVRKKFLKKVVSASMSLRTRRFKRVLLVDDIMTTGATLEVHSRLLSPFANRIDVFCLARALKQR